MPPAVSMPQAQEAPCREGNAGQGGRSPPLPCGTFLRLGENRLGKRQGQNKYSGSFRAFRHLPSSLADDNARKKKYMHGATAVNVMLSQTQGSSFPEEAGNCSGRGRECMRQ